MRAGSVPQASARAQVVELNESYSDQILDFSSGLMEMLDGPVSEGTQVVIHGTFDDFGKCDRDGFVGLAGYLALNIDWTRFNYQWNRVLRDLNLEYLHTAEYLQSIPVLGNVGHTDDTIKALLAPFTAVIKNNLVSAGTGIAVVVVTLCDAYNALSKEEHKVIAKPDMHSFEMAVGMFLKHTSTVLREKGPLAIQIDESRDAPRMCSIYAKLKELNSILREYLAAICFVDDKNHPAIQAADLLSHLAAKSFRRSMGHLPWLPAFTELVENASGVRNCDFLVYGEDRLKALAKRRMVNQDRFLTDFDVVS